MLKKILFLSLLTFFSLCSCSNPNSDSSLIEKSTNNSVGVEKVGKIIQSGEEIFKENTSPETLFSNGFFIDERTIITTAHSVGDFQDSYNIHTISGKIFPAELIQKDEKNDIAKLQISENLQDFTSIKFEKYPKVGDQIFSLIYDIKTKKIQKKSGKIIQISDTIIFTDLQLEKGDSGSALYLNDGKIIGINKEFDTQKRQAIAVKIEIL